MSEDYIHPVSEVPYYCEQGKEVAGIWSFAFPSASVKQEKEHWHYCFFLNILFILSEKFLCEPYWAAIFL